MVIWIMAIDPILALRTPSPSHDTELWEFADGTLGRPLQNLTVGELQNRLSQIDRNIQYLDSGSTPRDTLRADKGWISPWWWFRTRHRTILEFSNRGITPTATPDIPAEPLTAGAIKGVCAGGTLLLTRISARRYLDDMLHRGVVRLAPASTYRDTTLGAARADEELAKTYRRPGNELRITGPDGRPIKLIGDVSFSSQRSLYKGGAMQEIPYWMCSFSTDLDPRLFSEFGTGPDSACIVIFDPREFVRRALPHLNRAVPHATKQLLSNEYFDPYYPPAGRLSVLRDKEMPYAYQREIRLIVDPEGSPLYAVDKPIFIEAGSIEDIAAIYAPDGRKLSGVGPDSFLA